jgi:antitoxin component of MazEF toxin-antitoxin module
MAKQLGVAEGVEVDVRLEGTRLVVEKANPLPAFDHDDLVRSLKKARRDLVEYGPPRGGEEL